MLSELKFINSHTDIYLLLIYISSLGLHTFVCLKCEATNKMFKISLCRLSLCVSFVARLFVYTQRHAQHLIALSPLFVLMSAVCLCLCLCMWVSVYAVWELLIVAAIRYFQHTQFDSVGNVRLEYVYCVQNYLLNAVIRRLEWCAFCVVTHFSNSLLFCFLFVI